MKVKVTITRTEHRQHTFEVEMPDNMNPVLVKANAIVNACEEAYNLDWHNVGSGSANYDIEGVEVSE